jgi:4-hydroxy-tetrahydrodipicolinate synthase
VKDSSGDLDYFKKLCDLAAERPDWSLLIGSESSLAEAIEMGADGGVTGGANIAPRLLVDLYGAAVKGEADRVAELRSSLQHLRNIYQGGEYAAGTIRGLKCALELLGICSGRMADPHRGCDEAQRQLIARELVELGLMAKQNHTATSSAAAAQLS